MNSSRLSTLDRSLASVLRSAVKELKLSAKTYARIIIVAREFADRSKAERIERPHLFEALQYCTLAEER